MAVLRICARFFPCLDPPLGHFFFYFCYVNSVSVLYYLKSCLKNMQMFEVGAVIQAAELVYEERSWPNVTSPHEAPNEEINPGFTPGSGETFRLSPHTHTQKSVSLAFFFFSFLLYNRLPLSSLMTGCGSSQRQDLEER